MNLGELIKRRVDAAIEANQDDGLRSHLGPSALSTPCDRAIWYNFRWHTDNRRDARMLRLFERGNNEEPAIIRRLRLAGITVHDVDVDGKQYGFSDCEGHFKGSVDGVIEVPDVNRVGLLEIKTRNAKGYRQVLREREIPTGHYNQMQCYMHYLKLEWGLHIMACKDDDEWHFTVVPYDRMQAETLVERAKGILRARTPPEKLSDDPTYRPCTWCDHYAVCHKDEKPMKNCRTCEHSRIRKNEKWVCSTMDNTIINMKVVDGNRIHMPCGGERNGRGSSNEHGYGSDRYDGCADSGQVGHESRVGSIVEFDRRGKDGKGNTGGFSAGGNAQAGLQDRGFRLQRRELRR